MQIKINALPLHRIWETPDVNGTVVQLVRIHACHAWGHGFESRPHRKRLDMIIRPFFMGYPYPQPHIDDHPWVNFPIQDEGNPTKKSNFADAIPSDKVRSGRALRDGLHKAQSPQSPHVVKGKITEKRSGMGCFQTQNSNE